MSFLSFRVRLTLRWTLAFGLLLALANTAIYAGARAYLTRDLDAQLRTLAATELASAVDEYQGVHLHPFQVDVFGGGEYADKFVQLYDAGGRLLKQSPSLGAAGPLLTRARVRDAVAGRAPIVAVEAAGHPARMIALSAAKDGQTYVMAVGLYSDKLALGLRRLAVLLTAVWALGLLLTAGLGFVLSSRALIPIDRITSRAALIARGEFAARLDPPAVNDEIGRMTQLLNEMLDRLNAALDAHRRFAADASHELRSPLTAIQGEIDVTLKRPRTAEEYRATLALVRERLGELTALTENLMLLVRAQERRAAVDLHEVPLQPLLQEAAARLAGPAGARGVTIAFDRFPALVAYADPRLLGRAFDNLLRNAVQYNRDAGRVTIAGIDEPACDRCPTGAVVVRIRDTGMGIPDGERERVFERFYRLDRSRSRRTGGSGLGLAICREVLSLFQGTVRVAASSPEGTTMEVRLPGRRVGDQVVTGPVEGVAAPSA
ncbi:MAG: HAMP domain-containing protein [Acidobacteriota bacterium]|nr:HAMP domain-containing protein [Acidobacteriota bacterium]